MFAMFEKLNVFAGALVAVAGLGAMLWVALPITVGIITMVVMGVSIWYANHKFHFDKIDPSSIAGSAGTVVAHRKQVLSTTRAAFGLICPIAFGVLIICAGMWKHAPEMVNQAAVRVIGEDIHNDGRVAVRYVAAPAISVSRAPDNGQVGRPIVAPAPSVEALRTQREIAALPLPYVLERSLASAGQMLTNLAWVLMTFAGVLAFVLFWTDIFLIRPHALPAAKTSRP